MRGWVALLDMAMVDSLGKTISEFRWQGGWCTRVGGTPVI
jgi:hypothetical protein